MRSCQASHQGCEGFYHRILATGRAHLPLRELEAPSQTLGWASFASATIPIAMGLMNRYVGFVAMAPEEDKPLLRDIVNYVAIVLKWMRSAAQGDCDDSLEQFTAHLRNPLPTPVSQQG